MNLGWLKLAKSREKGDIPVSFGGVRGRRRGERRRGVEEEGGWGEG